MLSCRSPTSYEFLKQVAMYVCTYVIVKTYVFYVSIVNTHYREISYSELLHILTYISTVHFHSITLTGSHTHVCTHICMYVHTYVHMYVHTYVCAYIHMCICTYLVN